MTDSEILPQPSSSYAPWFSLLSTRVKAVVTIGIARHQHALTCKRTSSPVSSHQTLRLRPHVFVRGLPTRSTASVFSALRARLRRPIEQRKLLANPFAGIRVHGLEGVTGGRPHELVIVLIGDVRTDARGDT